MAKRIYLDYASLTPIDPRVHRVIAEYSTSLYGNPSSIHAEGVEAKKALDRARARVASFIHAHPDEIIFTGSGTEANNIAIIGAVHSYMEKGVNPADLHVITSVIEHSSVLECVNALESKGVKVDRISVDSTGRINMQELKETLRPETVLVSIMMVNNEIGTIEPIVDIAKTIRHSTKTISYKHIEKPLLHTDASQAPLYLDLRVEALNVDLLTIDGHKVYGPRGIGALYVKRYTSLVPTVFGGGQEHGLRSATHNIPAICGLAKALDIAEQERAKEGERLIKLNAHFIEKLQEKISTLVINGSDEFRIPHIVNISIPHIDNEFFLLQLDAQGIACATKSSCLKDVDHSYVLQSLHVSPELSRSSLRFSCGRYTSMSDINTVIKTILKILKIK